MDSNDEKHQPLLNAVQKKNVLFLYPNQIEHLYSLESSRYELCKAETEIAEMGDEARMFLLKIISMFALMTVPNYLMAAWVLSEDSTFYLVLFMLGIVYLGVVGMAFRISWRKLKLMRWKIEETRRRSVTLKRNIQTFENSLNPTALTSPGQVGWENVSSGHVIMSFDSAKDRIIELIASLGPPRFWDDQKLYLAFTGLVGVLCIVTLGIFAFYLRRGWRLNGRF